MPYTLQFKRYSTVTLGTVTGAAGELIVDTTKDTVTVHDGATVGGFPLATEIFVSSAASSIITTVTGLLLSYATNANLTSTLSSYALKTYADSAASTVSSYLVNYTQNINLTSTLSNYATNANLTSTLNSYQLITSNLTLTTLTSNIITVTNTSNATTATSGAIRVSGGMGIKGDIFVGSGAIINFNNALTVSEGTISRPNGAFYLIGGGSQLSRNCLILSNAGGAILYGGSATNNAPATTGIYGIRLAGGDGNVSVINSSDSTSISTGSFVVSGGVGITKRLNVGDLASFSSGVNITYQPASTVGAAISLSAKDTQGGTGYADFLKVTNTTSGATNSSKTFRLSSAGAVEIINNAYSATLMALSDTGSMSTALPYQVAGKQAVNGPAFSAYANNTLQTITSGSLQKVLFQVEEFDTDSCFASSRFTPTVEGYYQINAEVRFDGASGTGEMMIVLYKNGSAYKRGTNQSGTQIASNFWAMQVSSLVYANGTTDYFEIYVQQGSGGTLSVTAVNDPAITWFNGSMVRGA